MTPSEFCYWLQGWTELEGGKKPNLEQWLSIKAHLNLVFNKVTPDLQTLLEQADFDNSDCFKEVEFPEVKDLGLYDENDLPERLPEDEQPIGPASGYDDEPQEKEPVKFCAKMPSTVPDAPVMLGGPHTPFEPPRGGRPMHLDHLEKICSNNTELVEESFKRVIPRQVRNDK